MQQSSQQRSMTATLLQGGAVLATGYVLARLMKSSQAKTEKRAYGQTFSYDTNVKSLLVNLTPEEVGEVLRRESIEGVTVEAAHGGKRSLIKASTADFSDVSLRQLKALIETGEIPTVEGQSHGKRSALGKVIRNLDQSHRLERRA